MEPMNPYVIPAILGLGLVYVAFPVFVETYRQFMGTRSVNCPESQQPASVQIDATHAALTGFLTEPQVRLAHCSQWPGRRGCRQECRSQL